jgi:hypothetical protein
MKEMKTELRELRDGWTLRQTNTGFIVFKAPMTYDEMGAEHWIPIQVFKKAVKAVEENNENA